MLKKILSGHFVLRPVAGLIGLLLTSPPLLAHDREHEEEPLGAAVILIELTDNDIELQLFADAFDWTRLQVFDPRDRSIFDTRSQGRLTRQGGMSELAFASEPSHYLVDEPDFDESVERFLRRWPEGEYEFRAFRRGLPPLESDAYFSHTLAALSEITSPLEDEEVDPRVPLVIEWERVTERFIGDGPIDIIEYQVIVNQEEPQRAASWIDGHTRRTLANLPGDVTVFRLPPEALIPNAEYEIEVLSIAANGNASIGVVAFATSD